MASSSSAFLRAVLLYLFVQLSLALLDPHAADPFNPHTITSFNPHTVASFNSHNSALLDQRSAPLLDTHASTLLNSRTSTLLYSYRDDEQRAPHFDIPSDNLFYRGPTGAQIPLSKFRGTIESLFTDYCGTAYVAGRFDQVFYNVTRSTSYMSWIHGGFEYSALAMPIPLFIINPQTLRGLSTSNSWSGVLFHRVLDFQGAILSVYADCGPMKSFSLQYCSASCDIFIGGTFSLQVDTEQGVRTIYHAALWRASTREWVGLFSDATPTSNTQVNYITRNNYGLWIATTAGLVYLNNDTVISEKPLTAYRKMFHFGDSSPRVRISFYSFHIYTQSLGQINSYMAWERY